MMKQDNTMVNPYSEPYLVSKMEPKFALRVQPGRCGKVWE